MGCFLAACFGFKGKTTRTKTTKKKRRKPGKRRPSEKQAHQSYVPLDSDFSLEQNNTSDSNHLKEKQKEAVIEKIKKKVRFDLNVKAYEPIPHNNDDFGIYLNTKWELSTLHYEEEEENVIAPSTHRYQNCRDSYDESTMLDDNDLDFDDIEEDEDDDEVLSSPEDFPWELKSDDDDVMMSSEIPEARKWSVRDRSRYVYSVLNPVENLSQWKVVKAKEVSGPPQYMCQKENLMY